MKKTNVKFSFIGKFDDFKVEGLMNISKTIFYYLKRKGYNISLNSFKADMFNVHSGGIKYLLDKRIEKKKTIYSLYTNIFFDKLHRIKFLLPNLFFYSKGRRLLYLRIFFYSIMNLFFPFSLKRYLLSQVKLVVVPTNHLKNKLNLKNCIVIPFGVDTSKFKVKKRKHVKVRCAYIGSLSVAKGLSDVISSYKLIHKEKKYEQQIEKLIYVSHDSYLLNKDKFKKNYNIYMHGKQSDISKVYNETDIVILPYKISSGSIGIPLTLLEAMSCGKTIITTDFPHLKEVGRGAVIYVKPNSPEQIASAIKKLVDNKRLRAELGRKARKIVEDNYTEEKMLRAYDELYKKLAENLK